MAVAAISAVTSPEIAPEPLRLPGTECEHAYAPCSELFLGTLHEGERNIAYSTAGDARGAPVLFFYPAGGNRRMLDSLHAPVAAAGLKLICVNRPGKGGTSAAAESGPKAHVAAACNDTVAVLDALGVPCASLLFMCAGTSFALAFAACKPERSDKLLGVASWTSPADTSETKLLYKLGAALPSWLVGPIVGNAFASVNSSVDTFPEYLVVSAVKSCLSEPERVAFDDVLGDVFVDRASWMKQEFGGAGADMAVLLSPGQEVGIDYGRAQSRVLLLHGEDDTMVPIASAECLAGLIPDATLTSSPRGRTMALFYCCTPPS